MLTSSTRLWLARALVFIVLAWNLQAALVFWLNPEAFAPSFELSGTPGSAAVRGIALLFVMWNVPYAVACWHPQRHKTALLEALAMQFIGVMGESYLCATLPAGHALLQASILRFIVFDAAGLVGLIAAYFLVRGQGQGA